MTNSNNIYRYPTYEEYIRGLAKRYNLGAIGLMQRCNDYLSKEEWETRKEEHDALEKILAEGAEE